MPSDGEPLAEMYRMAESLRGAGVPLSEVEAAFYRKLKGRLETSLYAFVRAAWHVLEPGKVFVPGWHIEAVCEHLERVTRGEIRRLAINVPFRSSKSLVVSVIWPAWVWTTDPGYQWLCVSHGENLAIRDCRKMRFLVQSDWYQRLWPITFARDENKKSSVLNDSQGHRIAAGITSGILGLSCDSLVVDDPHDRDDILSDVKLIRAIGEFREKLSTRLNNPETGAIVVIGQRLSEKDLFAHLFEAGFDRLVIPMRYESNHPYPSTTGWQDPRRKEGDLMCPARFPERTVAEQEALMGSYATSGQYQQRPAPSGGGMFRREWFPLVEASPVQAMRVRAWDKAATEGGGAWTVGLLMARTAGGVYFVEDVVRSQVSSGGRHALMKQVADLDAERYGTGAVVQLIEHEGGSAGKDAAMFEMRLLAGHAVHCERPTGSKEQRAAPFAAQCEAGNVRIVKGDYVLAYLDELSTFPVGKWKDQTDASSAAFMWLASAGPNRIDGALLASGEDPAEEHRPFDDGELDQLDPMLKELVLEMRESGGERRQDRWEDDD